MDSKKNTHRTNLTLLTEMHSINIVSKQPIDLTFLKTNGPIPDKEFSSALNKSNRTLTGIDENHMFNSLPFRTVLSKGGLK